MSGSALNVLFLCTGNSARSILAEALLNRDGTGAFRAYSAGSHPAAAPHPGTLAALERHGLDASAARSKSWDAFAGQDAPEMDMVITLCDAAAAETCPYWPGAPLRAHWSLPDPAASGEDAAFDTTLSTLTARIAALIALPRPELTAGALNHIGETA